MTELESIILGRKWRVFYQSDAGADHISGKTCFPVREIYIRDDLKGEEMLHVITHELTHAWLYELGQGQNQINRHQFDEEFICEFVAIHGASIIERSVDLQNVIEKNNKRKEDMYKVMNKDRKVTV